ncbi:MAG: IS3 family transposase [Burkholderia sp.]|nr:MULTISPECIES: IS3 family transposase [Bacteria]MCA3159050.1 IS3 family transposase [Burkholderiales bacterium]MBG9220464.1 IS3 family transposase [Bacteroides ovatus]MBG9233570.1 IS3 family transposase [Bacteroides ovatus]MBY8610684.1 IS3 family transposase [Burkholderia arboris]MCA3194608.1 IS3 family transposase [Cupriavidus sp.]
MSGKRYTDEFKIEAVKQVTERGHSVADVAQRLGITTHSLYAWRAKFDKPDVVRQVELDQSAEVRRLKAELKRVTEERDILKKGRRVLCKGMTARYAFMRAHINEHCLRTMCRVLGVHRSGYYVWQRQSGSARKHEDDRLLGLIKHHWLASGGVYGYRKITVDLRESGEMCSRHRVLRLMRREGLRAEVGYGSKPRYRGGPVGVVANILNREFAPDAPNRVWVTDITYIRTYEGWLYLAAVMDLYSRQIVGWATRSTMTSDLVLQALLAAVWKRKPGPGVMVHSDQGSQFTGDDWQSFLRAHHMVPSMSRRGNCHDNAVAESFFSALKKERIKRRIYPNRATAATDVFDYIEMFYNPIRRHGSAGDLSPVEFERRYALNGS